MKDALLAFAFPLNVISLKSWHNFVIAYLPGFPSV